MTIPDSATPFDRYFAWMREHTGASMETITLPEGVTCVGDLVPSDGEVGWACACAEKPSGRACCREPTMAILTP